MAETTNGPPDGGMTTPLYVPLAPLEAIARAAANHSDEEWGPATFAQLVGVSDRTITRWRKSGRILWHVADEAACALGMHPLNIWGDDWLALDAGIIDGSDTEGLTEIERALSAITLTTMIRQAVA